MTILDAFQRRHARSLEIYREAQGHFPSGVTHDARAMDPFPLAIESAKGAFKWDVDGNRLIDYWQGHGALLMGHTYGPVVEAVQRQVARGTHFGGNHQLEVTWAEQVKRCFPHIEQLRFTASGTEATMLALRLARAYTGKPGVIRFLGHFHGWHDMLAQGAEGEALPPGVLPDLARSLVVLPATIEAVERATSSRDDIGAVILEPTGASYGKQPLPEHFLEHLQMLCIDRGMLLICDEVVTGFRLAPGGAQELQGVQADLTCLAKVLAGGLPGGAVGGREAIMRSLAWGDQEWNERNKVKHHGTFNANPLAAAAGIAILKAVQTGTPQARANSLAARLRSGLNAELRTRNLRGCAAYGDASIVHLMLGSPSGFPPGEPNFADLPLATLKSGVPSYLLMPFRLAMLNYGIDLMRGTTAFVSAAHSEEDIEATIAAFGAALDMVTREGEL